MGIRRTSSFRVVASLKRCLVLSSTNTLFNVSPTHLRDVLLGCATNVRPNTDVRATGPMPKTVLVADDNPMIRKNLCEMFEREEDYELCTEAANGKVAIQLAREHRPDLIILDLYMPVMNGLDAACELKRIMPHVPIILFTVHAETVRNSASDLHIDRVVDKGDANLMSNIRELVPI
jgi:CheY-like chemotaxis protein